MVKKWVSLTFVSLLLFLTILPIANAIAFSPTGIETKQNAQFAREIVISSDYEFGDSWTGDGTVDNPYVLIPKIWYGTRIAISNTTSHFVIEDIILQAHTSYDNPTVSIEFSNVTNGMIVNSIIKPYLWPGYPFGLDDSTAISIENSSRILVEDCILADSGRGLWIKNSSDIVVSDNQIARNNIGIDLVGSFNTSITENKIVENADFGVRIFEGSNNSTIIGNYLGYNGISNALDNETSTMWDKDSQGNIWDDYDESGIYNISGTGSNFDDFPLQLNQDISPPDIELELGSKYFWWGPYTTITWTLSNLGPVTPSFYANVIDESGIDSVYLCIGMTWNEMTESSESDTYTYAFPDEYYNFFARFYVWANDTAGNVWTSPLWEFYYNGQPTFPSSDNDDVGNTLMIYLGIGLIVTLSIIVISKVSKR